MESWTINKYFLRLQLASSQAAFRMYFASDGSSMQVHFMITKDCDRLCFAYRTYLLVDRGP